MVVDVVVVALVVVVVAVAVVVVSVVVVVVFVTVVVVDAVVVVNVSEVVVAVAVVVLAEVVVVVTEVCVVLVKVLVVVVPVVDVRVVVVFVAVVVVLVVVVFVVTVVVVVGPMHLQSTHPSADAKSGLKKGTPSSSIWHFGPVHLPPPCPHTQLPAFVCVHGDFGQQLRVEVSPDHGASKWGKSSNVQCNRQSSTYLQSRRERTPVGKKKTREDTFKCAGIRIYWYCSVCTDAAVHIGASLVQHFSYLQA